MLRTFSARVLTLDCLWWSKFPAHL